MKWARTVLAIATCTQEATSSTRVKTFDNIFESMSVCPSGPCPERQKGASARNSRIERSEEKVGREQATVHRTTAVVQGKERLEGEERNGQASTPD